MPTIGDCLLDTIVSATYDGGMEYPAAQRGKCQTCGFLSKHTTTSIPGPRYFEVEAEERQRGEVFYQSLALYGSHNTGTMPECVKGVAQLWHETRGVMDDTEQELRTKQDAAIVVFCKERACEDWYPYQPGQDPIEHLRKYEMSRLEQDRQAFELKLFELEQGIHQDSKLILADSRQLALDSKQIAQDNTQLVAKIKSIAEQSDRFSRRITWLVIFLGVVQAASALIGLYLTYRASQNHEMLDLLDRLLSR